MSFITDQEKMVDFFTTTKDAFLNFYSYLAEEEYEETKKDVLARSGYWNTETLSEDKDVEGIDIAKIVQSIMMTEWLQNGTDKIKNRFDWDNFTKEHYYNYINGLFKIGECVGAVRIGDISIDLICYGANLLTYDFYVAHEDTGYGYKNDILPYDYADGDTMDTSNELSYKAFKNKAEKLFINYIENYNGNYSLIEHANKPLEIW